MNTEMNKAQLGCGASLKGYGTSPKGYGNIPVEYTVKVSTQSPITLWYDGRHCPPIRQVVYRSPLVKMTTDKVQYGIISYKKQRIVVIRRRPDVCHEWDMWEAARMIEPLCL
jgi:hypothetical protein